MCKLKEVDLEMGLPIIERCVCRYYQTDKFKVYIKKRKRESVIARQVIHYFAMQCSGATLQGVGLACGDKDHATVIYSRKCVNKFLSKDHRGVVANPEIERAIAFIKQWIETELINADPLRLREIARHKRGVKHLKVMVHNSSWVIRKRNVEKVGDKIMIALQYLGRN